VDSSEHVFQEYRNCLKNHKQTLEALRQDIEKRLLNDQLASLITQSSADPKVVANLITSLIKAIEKEGRGLDLAAFIPSHVSVKEVNQLLGEETLKKLKDHSVLLGDFTGGARLKLVDKKITLEVTDKELADLLSKYVRKDFRKLIFGQENL